MFRQERRYAYHFACHDQGAVVEGLSQTNNVRVIFCASNEDDRSRPWRYLLQQDGRVKGTRDFTL